MVLTTTLALQVGLPLLAVGIGIIAKIYPSEKLIAICKPFCTNLGKIISKFLLVRFGNSAFDRVAEGMIVTLLDVTSNCLGFCRDGLLSDNDEQAAKANPTTTEVSETSDAKGI
jgi:hypothetical protein